VVILGSRGGARSKTDSPVPVDVFNIKESSVILPQNNIGQILNAIAPSFTSTIQTNSDGTDHLDPAQLED
jgi:iron complex outermembrane receptor protein